MRSARRKKTSAASIKGDHIEVRIPAWVSEAEEQRIVAQLREKLQRRQNRNTQQGDLQQRADQLNEKFLDGRAQHTEVRWVSNQNSRWGSCTPSTGVIRINDALMHAPQYVVDAVIIHELVHTFILDGHSAEFWRWADRAPRAERAKGYLEALATLRAAPDQSRPAL